MALREGREDILGDDDSCRKSSKGTHDWYVIRVMRVILSR